MPDFKAKMHKIRFALRLGRRSRWGSLQRSSRPPSCIYGGLFLRGIRGKGKREGRGRGEKGKEKGREGGRKGKGGSGPPNILA